MSTKLFTLAMEDILRALDWTNMGRNINGNRLNDAAHKNNSNT